MSFVPDSNIVISAVVPVLNAATTIGDTLRALVNQVGAPEPREIIVVDNGSTDGTPGIVAAFPVKLLHSRTPGVSAARNVGLRAARGAILVNVDADTLPTRTYVRELVRPFANPAIVLVGGRTLSFKPETAAERYIEQAGLFRPENSIQNVHLPFVIGCNLAVRRESAHAVNGWDESLLRGEDIDFSLRVRRQSGSPPHYQPDAVLFHRNRSTDKALAAQARGYGHGMALIYRRYPDEVRWNAGLLSLALRRVAWRSLLPLLLRLRRITANRDAGDLEFARCDRIWSIAYWRGFLATYYGRASRP